MSLANRWRVYIKPFDSDGNLADWIEVTDDVVESSLGVIQQDLDNVDYNVGVFRNNSISITLRNEHGRYSDVNVEQSIFRHKRMDSLVKFTFEPEIEAPYLGASFVGDSCLSDGETEIFLGLLNDESLSMDLDAQQVQFQVLGRESALDRMKVPYGSLSNGQLISAVIHECLDDPRVTSLLTLDAGNIDCDTDVAIDDVSQFENKTVKTALQELLLVANSVMFIENGTIYITPRAPTPDVKFTFYGQASPNGPENITTVKGIKNGLSRTFNFWVWRDTSLSSENSSSANLYGVRRKEIDVPYITNGTSRQTILDNLKNEFGNPKMELELATPFNLDTFAVSLLDRVVIDYPTVYVQTETPPPICGIAICGQVTLPRGLWSFTMDNTRPFKVLGRAIDMKKSEIRFKLREI
jgi:hypothetical protein